MYIVWWLVQLLAAYGMAVAFHWLLPSVDADMIYVAIVASMALLKALEAYQRAGEK